MWLGVVLIGVALVCTLLVGVSASNFDNVEPGGARLAVVHTLALIAVLWLVLGSLLMLGLGSRSSVPPPYVVMLYLLGGVAEVSSLVVLADRTTDRVAVLGLRAGIVAVPLMLVLFAGVSL